MMLDCKFTMVNGTKDTKLLALTDSGALFNSISSSVAKRLSFYVLTAREKSATMYAE